MAHFGAIGHGQLLTGCRRWTHIFWVAENKGPTYSSAHVTLNPHGDPIHRSITPYKPMNAAPQKSVTEPTADRLRYEIDRGRGGDKVNASDPAVAPLGTDD